MNRYWIAFIIIMLILCFGAVAGAYIVKHKNAEYEADFSLRSLRCAFIAGAVIFGAMAAIHSIRLSEVLIIEKTVGDKADWTYYLDGEEVACDNIDISNYKVSFDEEEHKVFLTSRSERGTLFFPVVVP